MSDPRVDLIPVHDGEPVFPRLLWQGQEIGDRYLRLVQEEPEEGFNSFRVEWLSHDAMGGECWERLSEPLTEEDYCDEVALLHEALASALNRLHAKWREAKGVAKQTPEAKP
jgi:hypothetical protein